MKTQRTLSLASILALAAIPGLAQLPASNPFAAPSPLPFQAPPFDRIKDADYAPAIEEGMKRQLAEIEAIANDPAPPTFANTIEAMERSGELLTRAAKVFFNLDAVEHERRDAEDQGRGGAEARRAPGRDLPEREALRARQGALRPARRRSASTPRRSTSSSATTSTSSAPARELSDADKTTLHALNQEESKLTTEFADKLLADTNASAVVVSDRAQLAGLDRRRHRRRRRGARRSASSTASGSSRLQNTTQQPVARVADEPRAPRAGPRGLGRSAATTAAPNDTKAIVARLAQLRAQQAKLLGFPTYAAYVLDDQMAKTPAERGEADDRPRARRRPRRRAARRPGCRS